MIFKSFNYENFIFKLIFFICKNRMRFAYKLSSNQSIKAILAHDMPSVGLKTLTLFFRLLLFYDNFYLNKWINR